MRTYVGDETQTADPLIVAKEGQSPAYRGLAYVVFERLPLANFGNRIPQLSFEVMRPVGQLEQMMRAVTLIPGATEFGYEPATVVQQLGPGQSAPENRHVSYAASDVIASLDDLQAAAPNIERVSIVVAWFGSDLRCGQCRIVPKIDNAAKSTYGGTWSVAGLTRGSAQVVSQVDGRPAFGGTPADQSVIDLIAELKSRGLKITLYPFLMMDIATDNVLTDPYTGAGSQPVYPWRGRITCDPAPGVAGSPDGTADAATQVDAFFSGGADSWNYRNMILHYANLAASAGGVDAIVIGSELKALTRVRSASGVYPAVDALTSLAAEVKAIVGSGCAVTYGADWTEYGAHVVDTDANEVRFPLDALWASSSIDAVGIDYYAPLADWRDYGSQLDLALTDSPYRQSYLTGYLNARRGLRLVLRRRCSARCADAFVDHRRARQALGVPAKGPVEFLVAGALRARRRRRAWHADGVDAAIKADLVHRSRLSGGRQGRQPAELVSRSEVVGEHAAALLERQARRSDAAALSRGRARRLRSGLRRGRAQSGVERVRRPHDRRLGACICGPGTRGLIRLSRRRPTPGATGRTGRPGTG